MALITPAILATSRADFEEKLARFAMVPAVQRIQLDVVDGRFAGPASWPFTDVADFRKMLAEGKSLPLIPRFEYEIDLMVLEPENAALSFMLAGATRLVIHAESTTSIGRVLAVLRRQSGHEKDFMPNLLSIGLALNGTTDTSIIEPYLDQIDFVQFMGIARIGKQGEPFDKRVLTKIQSFHHEHPQIPLQVDGGVTLHTAPALLALGVQNLVVGHDLLQSDDISAEVSRFEKLTPQFGV